MWDFNNPDHCKTTRTELENFRKAHPSINEQQAISIVLERHPMDETNRESFRKFLTAVNRGIEQRRRKRQYFAHHRAYEEVREAAMNRPRPKIRRLPSS